VSRVHLVEGNRCFACSKCGARLLTAERDRDGARTGRLWVNLSGGGCIPIPPPADGRRRGDDRRGFNAPLPKEPPPVRLFANVPWPGPADTPVYTLVGECPKCHGRVRADARELWGRLAIALLRFGAGGEAPTEGTVAAWLWSARGEEDDGWVVY
jgi:hypothetical protein